MTEAMKAIHVRERRRVLGALTNEWQTTAQIAMTAKMSIVKATAYLRIFEDLDMVKIGARRPDSLKNTNSAIRKTVYKLPDRPESMPAASPAPDSMPKP
jgi:hypothetical protein